jgi:hypothetical protein
MPGIQRRRACLWIVLTAPIVPCCTQEAVAPTPPTAVTVVVAREDRRRHQPGFVGGANVELIGTIVTVIIGIPVWLWSEERLHHVWTRRAGHAMPGTLQRWQSRSTQP